MIAQIPLSIPFVGFEEERAASEVIRSGWVTQGPKVAEFERVVADYCGTADAVAVSSCTTALHMALLVLGIGPDDEVICPSLSFIATANAIRYTGAIPVFADVDLSTFNLDPVSVEAAITERTKAILVVHQLGMPADMDALLAIAAKHGVKIIEDAAPAIGSRYKGCPIGGHSEMACFSFHPRKIITTGEGGIITTNNPEYASRLRLLRQHGMSIPDTVRHQAKSVLIESYVCLGYNYRMTDIQAAIGIEQMKRLDWILARRRQLAERYTQLLSCLPEIRVPQPPAYAEPNYQSYAVVLTDQCSVERDALMQRLLDKGVSTRRGVMAAHLETPYRDLRRQQQERGISLNNTEYITYNSLCLPLFPSMTDEQLEYVVDALQSAVQPIERC